MGGAILLLLLSGGTGPGPGPGPTTGIICLGPDPVMLGPDVVTLGNFSGDGSVGDLGAIHNLTLSAFASWLGPHNKISSKDLGLEEQLLLVNNMPLETELVVTTTPVALDTGGITNGGLLVGKNRGTTAVNVREGSGGTDVVKFPPGLGFHVYIIAAAPYIVAESGTAKFEYKFLNV